MSVQDADSPDGHQQFIREGHHVKWPNIVPPAPEDPPEPDPAPVEKIVSLAVRVNGEPVEVVHQPDPAPDEWAALLKAYKALKGSR